MIEAGMSEKRWRSAATKLARCSIGITIVMAKRDEIVRRRLAGDNADNLAMLDTMAKPCGLALITFVGS